MNERIRKLAVQAGFDIEQLKQYPGGFPREDLLLLESFAELIVRECIDVVDNVYHEQTGMGNKPSRRRTPYQEIVNALEDHFGVE